MKTQKVRRRAAPTKTPRKSSRKVEGECIIPAPLRSDVLSRLVLNRHPREGDHIRQYVESEAPDEKVVHLDEGDN